jgi:hypothetical protein
MAVGTLQGALRTVVPNVDANNNLTQYNLWLDIFGQSVSPPFNNRVVNQRTVTNWIYPSLEVRDELPSAGDFSNQETEAVIDIVFRTLSAVIAAEDAGRISAAQADMVLDQYNLAWP